MDFLLYALLILAGFIAMSGVIVAKRPDARAVLDKLVPFQAIIGVALLVVAVIFFLKSNPLAIIKGLKTSPVINVVQLVMVLAGVVLGFLFGLPQIAKWAGGNNPKAQELAGTLAPYTVLIGMVALVAGLAGFLYRIGLMQKIIGD